ncbi:MAG: tRNA cyclic N6-threonylcarbamoyladenosine(37) synthase TcdA [Gammaproteobacteria bacterium]|nr:tRNA cyclic N6-threonylcarbamoyladenosine(37) synthase TcdA [Gammaproteobacteria bacterium]
MTSSDYSKRFSGIQRLYGVERANIIANAHVCVIGIGGVGSWVAEALVRSGIGQITLIDNDDIALTNMNRQIHTLSSTLGQQKVLAMAERLLQINPELVVNVIDDFITVKTFEDFLSRGYDYVVDAIDSIKFKTLMINYCKRNKIPIITIGGAGGVTDPTKVEVVDLSRTYNDPLTANVRQKLRQEFGFNRNLKRKFGVECVYSTQQQVYPKDDGTVSQQKPGIHGVSLDCSFGYGASSCVTATFGFVAAARVIEKLKDKSKAPPKALPKVELKDKELPSS